MRWENTCIAAFSLLTFSVNISVPNVIKISSCTSKYSKPNVRRFWGNGVCDILFYVLSCGPPFISATVNLLFSLYLTGHNVTRKRRCMDGHLRPALLGRLGRRVDLPTRAQLSHRKGIMPNSLWYTDIFGLEVYNRMQKLSSCASINAQCNFINRQVPSDRRSCRKLARRQKLIEMPKYHAQINS